METKIQEEGWAADEKQHQFLNMLPIPTSFTSRKQQVAVTPTIGVASVNPSLPRLPTSATTGLAGPEYMKKYLPTNIYVQCLLKVLK